MLEKVDLICNLIIAICGIVPTIISMITLVKNIIENKNWDLVVSMIKKAMSAVELYAQKHPGMKSSDKLDMAVAAVKESCAAAGILVDDILVQKIIAYINELCSWAKTVNAKN